MGGFRSLWHVRCVLAEDTLAHRFCMRSLMNGLFPSLLIPRCLLSLCHSMWCSPWYWCSAGRVKPQVWDPGLPWTPPLRKTAHGIGLFRDEPEPEWFTLCQFLYFSHFWIAVWFSTPLPNDGSLSRYSATNAQLPVPEFTWHFLPLAEKHSYGAEIKPADSCTMLPWKYLPKSIWDPTLEPSCFLPLV